MSEGVGGLEGALKVLVSKAEGVIHLLCVWVHIYVFWLCVCVHLCTCACGGHTVF